MALATGSRIGPYEIVAAIGAGGMGEVYRARDTRLKRDVALKVLPESFATDPDRLSRFEREAQVLASLNHPRIAAIHGLEETEGTRAIVMELVEGETLADRIARGPLPVEEALPIARQIAEALEAAHDQGIIHRDLKPANIKVTPDGGVKVLDFGLAKLTETGSGARDSGFEAAKGPLSVSPTITSPMMTGDGVLLGTAAYMAPEQAKGRPADQRSDIWAFGCVCYEMLTGARAFDGEDMVDVLGAVARLEPNWSALPPQLPHTVRVLLQRCLVKERRRRLGNIAAAHFLLENVSELSTPAAAASPSRPATSRRRLFATFSAASIAVAAATGAVVWFVARPAPREALPVQFQIPSPGKVAAEMFVMSPNGRSLAFVTNNGGANQIWVRAMDTLEARALPGTNDATYPFWSPDGSSIGFFAQGKLRKVATAGGPPQTLCDATSGRGGTWNRDGVILFSAGPASAILRVSAAGGVPTAVTHVVEGDVGAGHRFPFFLPDGVHFVYNAGSNSPESAGLYAGSLQDGISTRLLQDQTNAVYVPSAVGSTGHLVFRRQDTLMAQPFDPDTLAFVGEMVPVAEQVPNSTNVGFGAFSVSSTGSLAYRPGSGTTPELVWTDRAGQRITSIAKLGRVTTFSTISPDQRTVAFSINSGVESDIWLQDAAREVISRFTFRPGFNRSPVWAPDGKLVAFTHQEPTGYSYDIYAKSSTGGGAEELLLKGGVNAFTLDWSPDGQRILYQQLSDKTGTDLWLLPVTGDRKPVPFLQTPSDESNGKFAPYVAGSPQWIAYQSNESGLNQIYVQSIPANGAKYQISTAGGIQPTWRGDGKELFYISPDRKLMAVPVTLGATVVAGTPKELFTNAGMTVFTASKDGQRFLIVVPVGGENAGTPITVVLDWAPGLKK